MAVLDLISDARTGKLSHTKLWGNLANATATGMFVYQGVTAQLTPAIWLAYLGTVGGYVAVLRGISAWRDVATANNQPEQSQ